MRQCKCNLTWWTHQKLPAARSNTFLFLLYPAQALVLQPISWTVRKLDNHQPVELTAGFGFSLGCIEADLLLCHLFTILHRLLMLCRLFCGPLNCFFHWDLVGVPIPRRWWHCSFYPCRWCWSLCPGLLVPLLAVMRRPWPFLLHSRGTLCGRPTSVGPLHGNIFGWWLPVRMAPCWSSLTLPLPRSVATIILPAIATIIHPPAMLTIPARTLPPISAMFGINQVCLIIGDPPPFFWLPSWHLHCLENTWQSQLICERLAPRQTYFSDDYFNESSGAKFFKTLWCSKVTFHGVRLHMLGTCHTWFPLISPGLEGLSPSLSTRLVHKAQKISVLLSMGSWLICSPPAVVVVVTVVVVVAVARHGFGKSDCRVNEKFRSHMQVTKQCWYRIIMMLILCNVQLGFHSDLMSFM